MLTIFKIAGLLVGLSLIGGVIGTGISLWSEKRKKNNKLTRSDQKRGKKDKEKVRGSYNRTKRQEGSTQEYSGFGEYVKNTGDRRKKKNKLTRSDKKRP